MAAPCVAHVIVDSGGFIKNAPIWEIGENVYTIQEVVHESCDKATRQRLQVIPYDLKFKQPSSEAIVFVSEFAKKTGDYQSLSAVDIKVIALTYMLEKEHVGTDHIRKEPVRKPPGYSFGIRQTNADTNVSGFYLASNSEKSQCEREERSTDCEEDIHPVLEDEKVNSQDKDGSETQNSLQREESTDIEEKEDCLNVQENSLKITEEADADNKNVDSENLDEKASDGEEDDNDDDGGGWITPSNIVDVKRKMGEVGMKEKTRVQVACLTTDFAMQNVLIQMGLNVVSVDGMLIKSARNYVLRCFACRKITYNMTKIFCPMCGNKTLKRVVMQRHEDGTVEIFISKRPLNTRGMKFSLPTPQGGKHANNPVLFEDQRVPQQRASKQSKAKMDIFDPDYIAGSSPFAMNDVTSRASHFGIYDKSNVGASAYFNRKNPNEARRRTGRRK